MYRFNENNVADLLADHRQELKVFIARRMGSVEFVEDVLQDTYLRLSGASAIPVQNPRPFLYKVVANLIIDRQRAARRYDTLFTSSEDESADALDLASPQRTVLAEEQLRLLNAAVSELPPRCREVFILRKFDHLSQVEIAKRLGITQNMVEKHLRNALKHCRNRLFQQNN